MNYGSCSCCNKVIKYDRLRVCDECLDKYLHVVKDYLYDNGAKTLLEIYSATGVPRKVIEYFINTGALSTKPKIEDSKGFARDEDVLKRQEQLAILEALKGEFSHKISVEEEKEDAKPEMRFMNRNRGR